MTVFIEWSENLANYILGQDLRGLRERLALKPFNHFVTSKKRIFIHRRFSFASFFTGRILYNVNLAYIYIYM